MSKIQLMDSVMDVIVKMSEGNPGAATCLAEIMGKNDWHNGTDSLAMILSLDTLGLYGSNLYMIWNDCCDRDLIKLELVIRNWQLGELSDKEIYNNLAQGRGTPFQNLKTLDELFV